MWPNIISARIVVLTIYLAAIGFGANGCATNFYSPSLQRPVPKLIAEPIEMPENYSHAGEYDEGPYYGIVESPAEMKEIWGQLQAYDSRGRTLSRNEVEYPDPPRIDFRREYVVWVSLHRARASWAGDPMFEVDEGTGELTLTVQIHHGDTLNGYLFMWRAPKTYPPSVLKIVHEYFYGP